MINFTNNSKYFIIIYYNAKIKSKSNKKTKKCLSCVPGTGLIAKTTKKRANWKTRRGMKTIFPDDKIPSLVNPKLVHPKDYDQTVQIDLGKNLRIDTFFSMRLKKINQQIVKKLKPLQKPMINLIIEV